MAGSTVGGAEVVGCRVGKMRGGRVGVGLGLGNSKRVGVGLGEGVGVALAARAGRPGTRCAQVGAVRTRPAQRRPAASKAVRAIVQAGG